MVFATVTQWVSPWAALCNQGVLSSALSALVLYELRNAVVNKFRVTPSWGFLCLGRNLWATFYTSDGISLSFLLISTKGELSSMQWEQKTRAKGTNCVLWSKTRSFLHSLQFRKSVGMDSCQLADPIFLSIGSQHICEFHVCCMCQISLHLSLGNLAFDEQMLKTLKK